MRSATVKQDPASYVPPVDTHETQMETFARLAAIETDNCVEWERSTNGKGYGTIKLKDWHVYTHSLALTRREPAPSGYHEVAHSCGNRLCMNHRHLRWATSKENEADKLLHDRHNRGVRHGLAKLSESDVRDIRRHYAERTWTQRELARIYGVSQSNVSTIVSGLTWGWLAS